MGAPIFDGAFGRVAKAHCVRQRTIAQSDDFEFLWFLSFSGFGLSELEQFGLFHVTLFLAVHLRLTGCFRFGYSRREARTAI